ncbi:MAG: WD40 repeat domain-containing protein, partial [Halobacteria archaeon]
EAPYALSGGGGDGMAKHLRIWDISTGLPLGISFQKSGRSSGVFSVAWSPDGAKIAIGTGNEIRISDVSTGSVIKTLKGHAGDVNSVAWSRDGTRIVSGSQDFTARIWNPSTGAILRVLEHPAEVFSIALSPDGSLLATGSPDESVRVWDLSTGSIRRALKHNDLVLSVAWSPDGTKLASGTSTDDRKVRIWDVSTGSVLSTLSGHTNAVDSITWSPDGVLLASASTDDTVRIWGPAVTIQSRSTSLPPLLPTVAPVCAPDGVCKSPENYQNCPSDCPAPRGEIVGALRLVRPAYKAGDTIEVLLSVKNLGTVHITTEQLTIASTVFRLTDTVCDSLLQRRPVEERTRSRTIELQSLIGPGETKELPASLDTPREFSGCPLAGDYTLKLTVAVDAISAGSKETQISLG